MKVKVISDTHNKHDELSYRDMDCDILIHCGDATTKGNYTEVRSFLEWFVRCPAKYKILLSGNHDKHLRRDKSELKELCKEYGIYLLDNEQIIINGRLIVGGNFVPIVRDGKYKRSIEDRKAAWTFLDEYTPMDIDILVTHTPAKGILDTNKYGQSIGCDILTEKIEKYKPNYHVFGHTHMQGGKSFSSNNTTHYNVACMNEDYELVRNYRTFEI